MELLEMCQRVTQDIFSALIDRYFSLSNQRFSSYLQTLFQLSDSQINSLKKKYINEKLLLKLTEININKLKTTGEYFDKILTLVHSIQGEIIQFYTDENLKLKGIPKEALDRKTSKSDTEEKPPLWASSIEIIKASYTRDFAGSNLEKLTEKTIDAIKILKQQVGQIELHLPRRNDNSDLFCGAKKTDLPLDYTGKLLSYFFVFLIENPTIMTRHSQDFNAIKKVFFSKGHELSAKVHLPRIAYLAQIDNIDGLNKFMHTLSRELDETKKSIQKSDSGWAKKIRAGLSAAAPSSDEKLDKIKGKREALCDGVFGDKCFGDISLFPNPKTAVAHYRKVA